MTGKNKKSYAGLIEEINEVWVMISPFQMVSEPYCNFPLKTADLFGFELSSSERAARLTVRE